MARRRARAVSGSGQTRHLGWVFTLNNWTEEEKKQVRAVGESDQIVRMIVAEEVGEQEATPHLQGYIEFKTQKSLSQVVDLFPRCHAEPRRGSPKQAWNYCEKGGGVIDRFGSLPTGPGHRSDLAAFHADLLAGMSRQELVRQHPISLRIMKGAVDNLLDRLRRTWLMVIIWCYGETGSGKSRYAAAQCVREDGEEPYYKRPGHRWWDGYYGQHDVILDDFRPGEGFRFPDVLGLFDRYPFQVEFKGGTIQFTSHRIFVTAPVRPEVMFQDLVGGEDVEQLLRRITEIRRFGPGTGPDGVIEVERHRASTVSVPDYAAGLSPPVLRRQTAELLPPCSVPAATPAVWPSPRDSDYARVYVPATRFGAGHMVTERPGSDDEDSPV